jgi:hypothetical protein
MYLQKVLSKKLRKSFYVVDVLRVTDENSRIEIRMDPRIRIRNKILLIRNTDIMLVACEFLFLCYLDRTCQLLPAQYRADR